MDFAIQVSLRFSARPHNHLTFSQENPPVPRLGQTLSIFIRKFGFIEQ